MKVIHCAFDLCLQFSKEVAAAIKSNCQIIPVLDNFDWPAKEKLPEDMRDIVSYHGIVYVKFYVLCAISR